MTPEGQDGEADRILAEGRAAHPGVKLEPEALARHLLRLGTEGELRRADLYLALACAEADPAALRAFAHTYDGLIAFEAAKVDAEPQFVSDTKDAVRARLLEPREGQLPRIAEYGGKGPLSAWVRVAAVRAALNLARDRRRPHRRYADLIPSLAAAPGDAMELRYLKSRYRKACNAAVRDAFATLTPEERNLLRLHHLQGLTVDELAPAYGVHRSTVARRIARAREAILSETKRRLQRELGGDPDGVDSLLRVMRSGMDITLDRLLSSESADE